MSVAALTERAGLTRRTFYSHYRDIPDFVEQVEAALLKDIRVLVRNIAATTLPELYRTIDALEPAPGSIELLCYLRDNGELIGSLLGTGGDPAFIPKLIDLACTEVSHRMKTGIVPTALGPFFDYYLTSVVASEVGMVQRWFATGMNETPEQMARIMTVLAFVRPGDLYGMPVEVNVPAFGARLMGIDFSAKE